MTTSLLKRSVLVVVGFLLLSVVAPLHSVGAAAEDDVCEGIASFDSGGAGCNSSEGSSIDGLIELGLNILTIVAGVVAVIMLIVAGFNYVTSTGDSSKISHAKNTLIYAIVGLVIVVFAQIIVQFVLARAS